jgi:hypothetical protein
LRGKEGKRESLRWDDIAEDVDKGRYGNVEIPDRSFF